MPPVQYKHTDRLPLRRRRHRLLNINYIWLMLFRRNHLQWCHLFASNAFCIGSCALCAPYVLNTCETGAKETGTKEVIRCHRAATFMISWNWYVFMDLHIKMNRFKIGKGILCNAMFYEHLQGIHSTRTQLVHSNVRCDVSQKTVVVWQYTEWILYWIVRTNTHSARVLCDTSLCVAKESKLWCSQYQRFVSQSHCLYERDKYGYFFVFEMYDGVWIRDKEYGICNKYSTHASMAPITTEISKSNRVAWQVPDFFLLKFPYIFPDFFFGGNIRFCGIIRENSRNCRRTLPYYTVSIFFIQYFQYPIVWKQMTS